MIQGESRRPLHWDFLGRIPYQEAVELAARRREAVKRGTGPEHLLLLEHPPVYTLGRNADGGGHPRRTGVARRAGDRGRGVRPRRPGHLSRARPARGVSDPQPEPGPARRPALCARPPGGADPHPGGLRRRAPSRATGRRSSASGRATRRSPRSASISRAGSPPMASPSTSPPTSPTSRGSSPAACSGPHDLDRAAHRPRAVAAGGRGGLPPGTSARCSTASWWPRSRPPGGAVAVGER